MCGINGIFAYADAAPPVDEAELLRTRERMRMRGPDGEGQWISPDRRIGLGHRRLAIIDLTDDGAQPMATPDGRIRITFNGEIYNYQALRRELESKGCKFQSSSDTEVILHLYRERGEDFVDVLRGMYAVAIWDDFRQGLLLARDPFGIKPLYYSDDGNTVRFASQVKSLLVGGRVDTKLEPAGHVGFFTWGHVPEPYTLYKGIRALPAGSTLWLDRRGHRRSRQFFDLRAELSAGDGAQPSVVEESAGARLRAALLDSVRHHLVADVPVGSFLSAGLDSATVTALACEVRAERLRTFTLGFAEFVGTPNDEVPLAKKLAGQLGVDHESRRITREDFATAHDQLLRDMDQPSTDGVNSYFVSKAAAAAGLKVVLSGLGGDELFAGYDSFRDIPLSYRLFRAFGAAPWLGRGFRYVAAPLLSRFTSPKYAGLLEYGGSYEGAYLLRRGMFMPWELPSILDGDIVRDGWNELQTLTRLRETQRGIVDSRLRITALEMTWYMRSQLLRDADWASMAHSLEIRLPFVDIALFRALIPMLRSTGYVDKSAMARVPALPLPDQMLARAKTGFAVPVREWMVQEKPVMHKERGLRGWAKHVYRASVERGWGEVA